MNKYPKIVLHVYLAGGTMKFSQEYPCYMEVTATKFMWRRFESATKTNASLLANFEIWENRRNGAGVHKWIVKNAVSTKILHRAYWDDDYDCEVIDAEIVCEDAHIKNTFAPFAKEMWP
jgi:hypothetical protein